MAAIKGDFKERNRKSCQMNTLGTAVDMACTNDNIYIPFLSKIHMRTLQEQPEHTLSSVSTTFTTSSSHCRLLLNTTAVAYASRQNLNSGQSCKQFLIEQSNLKCYRLFESFCDPADLNTEKHDIRMTFPSALFSQLLSSQ